MERRQIIELWRGASHPEVLVTLVRAAGSSYRRPGARLLLAGPEGYAGTISGGCLEAEVIRKALWLTRSGARIERYSTLFDDTAEIPFGLGCGGVVDLLLESAATPEASAILQAMERSLSGTPSTVLTWLPTATRTLARAVLSPAGDLLFSSPDLPEAHRAILTDLRARLSAGTLDLTAAILADDGDDLFLEHLEPPQRLVVLGAGDDARPLVSMAAMLGWTVVVADGRAQLARADRFPAAHQVVVLRDPHDLPLRATDAVVVMTHSYEQDRDLLAQTLPLSPRYLGLLGARHRSSLLLRDAAALTGLPLSRCCDALHAPVGLDLGGDGAEAIALAVLAEIQAVCQGKLGASRRLTPETVSEQIALGGAESRYLQAQCALDL